jgi:hypothetical protein
LLVYDNNEFISGKIDDKNHPQELLKDKLNELKDSAFAYAAHPMDVFDPVLGKIEPPLGGIAKWTEENYKTALGDPLDPEFIDLFVGLEIWNTRKTKEGGGAIQFDPYMHINPFDDNGNLPNSVDNWDTKLIEGTRKWDELMRGYLDPLRKIFISGGSDAHGDLNYVTEGFGPGIAFNDNAIGKVRTLVYAPGGKKADNILSGLRNGRSVVTDGPVVIFGIDRDEDGELEGNSRDVIIGDHAVLPLSGDARFFIQWNSTNEFGSIDEIVIVEGSKDEISEVPIPPPQDGLKGITTWIQKPPSAPAMHYYRIEGRVKDGGNILYRCLSNPIWINWVKPSCIDNNVPEGHWYGMYYDNINLSGNPVMVRDDDDGSGFLDFDWAYDGPGSDCGIDADNFSARWLKRVYFNGGTYRFTVTSDDGFRLYLDGSLVRFRDAQGNEVETWRIQGATTYNVDVVLSEGYHWIIMEYFENGGYAIAQLSWKQLSHPGCIQGVSPRNWKGEYFGNTNLSGSPLMVRYDGEGFLNFDWANDSPGSACGLGADNFSVRWTRNVNFDEGTYRFTVTSDDGFRLYLDGSLVRFRDAQGNELETWRIQGATTYTADVPLLGGDHDIKLEYYEEGGDAVVKLSWQQVYHPGCIQGVSPRNWKGEYFGNTNLTGGPLMVRYDGDEFLNFDWVTGSPDISCGLGTDNFSVRWTRSVYFDGGVYRFTVTSDDGFRLYVDGALKLQKWFDQGATTYTVDVPLPGGDHDIKLEYYENGGYAVAQLSWKQVYSCIQGVSPRNWKGEYFGNKDLIGSPLMVRYDGSGFLNFNWAYSSPNISCGVDPDNFSVRWTRSVYFNGGVYRFTVTGDDGVRLYIDGEKVLDEWRWQGATTFTVDVPLSGGEHDIKLEYYENGGYAVAKLSWKKL